MKKTIELSTNETPSNNEMCWTFNDPAGKPFMQIRSYTTELCFQLWEWGMTKKRTGETVWEWKAMDCYPWSLGSAVQKVGRYMTERCGGKTDDIRKMANTVYAVEKRLLEGLNEASD